MNPTNSKNQSGQIIIIALVFFTILLTLSAALMQFVAQYIKSERVTIARAQALQLAEAGIDEAAYQLNQSPSYTGETNTALGNGTFTVTVSAIDSQSKRITSSGTATFNGQTSTRIIKTTIALNSTTISFHYGIQAGNGGFSLSNSSSIKGNVFSTGRVTGSGNFIYGDVVSAGPTGVVYGVHATGTIYSNLIGNAGQATVADKDAYYTSILNTTVSGSSCVNSHCHPGSPDQPPASLPISDSQISQWETEAALGGTAICSGGTYNISSDTSIGPIKVPCDLNISGNTNVTINGHIWVTGNITVQNSSVVKMAASLGSQNVAIIADNPGNKLTSSIITVANTATFQNSGTAGSYVFLISMNNSAESGGAVAAFSLSNSASALIAYAPHGLIPLANSVSLKEVTAYKITLQNSAQVVYDTGLPSAVFESGPGGSWSYTPGTYVIMQ